jgi:dephospho-CoA kinase
VGLTGGIATGKSTVSSLLSSRDDETDFVIIDVDGIAQDILLPGKLGGDSVYHRSVAEFGSGILEESDHRTIRTRYDTRSKIFKFLKILFITLFLVSKESPLSA